MRDGSSLVSVACISRCAYGQVASPLSFAIRKMGSPSLPRSLWGQDALRGSKEGSTEARLCAWLLAIRFLPAPPGPAPKRRLEVAQSQPVWARDNQQPRRRRRRHRTATETAAGGGDPAQPREVETAARHRASSPRSTPADDAPPPGAPYARDPPPRRPGRPPGVPPLPICGRERGACHVQEGRAGPRRGPGVRRAAAPAQPRARLCGRHVPGAGVVPGLTGSRGGGRGAQRPQRPRPARGGASRSFLYSPRRLVNGELATRAPESKANGEEGGANRLSWVPSSAPALGSAAPAPDLGPEPALEL